MWPRGAAVLIPGEVERWFAGDEPRYAKLPPVCGRQPGTPKAVGGRAARRGKRRDGRRNVGWVIIHWFELGTLLLLCLNLWFVSLVLNALRETNRWLAFLTRVRWDEQQGPMPPITQ
jgi:hypothetical protein